MTVRNFERRVKSYTEWQFQVITLPFFLSHYRSLSAAAKLCPHNQSLCDLLVKGTVSPDMCASLDP